MHTTFNNIRSQDFGNYALGTLNYSFRAFVSINKKNCWTAVRKMLLCQLIIMRFNNVHSIYLSSQFQMIHQARPLHRKGWEDELFDLDLVCSVLMLFYRKVLLFRAPFGCVLLQHFRFYFLVFCFFLYFKFYVLYRTFEAILLS